ncbi:MAG: hypothetical protein ACE5EU_13565 [Paracoccaceae bacterium]
MTEPAEIPEWDYRGSGLLGFARDRREAAAGVMEAVLDGFGLAGKALRPLLPLGDRIAARRLAAMDDPYRDEILSLPALLGRPGAVAFSLSYEFGCTARVFEGGGAPQLFRTLDWPFYGLGARVEVVHLAGPAGDWITATWPGVMGAMHGAAPGRFVIALNQAPERRTGFGRAIDWLAAKRRFLNQTGLPPPHLLRRVFEVAPDYGVARRMLAGTPVAAPVIFTLAGASSGEACVIERAEAESASPAGDPAVATNHFTTALGAGRWRPRGHDNPGRYRAARALGAAPPVDRLAPPILNPLTRLALILDATGRLSVAGYEGAARVTRPRHAAAGRA